MVESMDKSLAELLSVRFGDGLMKNDPGGERSSMYVRLWVRIQLHCRSEASGP